MSERERIRILLADDDTELCALLTDYLSGEGFVVESVHDGDAAGSRALAGEHDVLVLDAMMPRANGFDVLRELRRSSPLPVIMLTARGDDVDRIVGLEIGADDYLVKPCNPRELAARVRAVMRRASGAGFAAQEELQIGALKLLAGQRVIELDGAPLDLTSTEHSVLEVLMRSAGSVVSKADLTEQALGRAMTAYDRAIDMHVSNLRKKLGPHPDGTPRIKTVRRIGYQLVR